MARSRKPRSVAISGALSRACACRCESQFPTRMPCVLALFMPGTGWTWYVTEGSPQKEDFLFFGFVVASKASSDTFCSRSSKVFATSWASEWNAILLSAKADSPMSYPRPTPRARRSAPRIRCALRS